MGSHHKVLLISSLTGQIGRCVAVGHTCRLVTSILPNIIPSRVVPLSHYDDYNENDSNDYNNSTLGDR